MQCPMEGAADHVISDCPQARILGYLRLLGPGVGGGDGWVEGTYHSDGFRSLEGSEEGRGTSLSVL